MTTNATPATPAIPTGTTHHTLFRAIVRVAGLIGRAHPASDRVNVALISVGTLQPPRSERERERALRIALSLNDAINADADANFDSCRTGAPEIYIPDTVCDVSGLLLDTLHALATLDSGAELQLWEQIDTLRAQLVAVLDSWARVDPDLLWALLPPGVDASDVHVSGALAVLLCDEQPEIPSSLPSNIRAICVAIGTLCTLASRAPRFHRASRDLAWLGRELSGRSTLLRTLPPGSIDVDACIDALSAVEHHDRDVLIRALAGLADSAIHAICAARADLAYDLRRELDRVVGLLLPVLSDVCGLTALPAELVNELPAEDPISKRSASDAEHPQGSVREIPALWHLCRQPAAVAVRAEHAARREVHLHGVRARVHGARGLAEKDGEP